MKMNDIGPFGHLAVVIWIRNGKRCPECVSKRLRPPHGNLVDLLTVILKMRRVVTRENLCFDAALDESAGHLLDDGLNTPTVGNKPFCNV